LRPLGAERHKFVTTAQKPSTTLLAHGLLHLIVLYLDNFTAK
jgi:hypothetical protein